MLKPERFSEMTEERKRIIMTRSMHDVSEVFAQCRDIVFDIKQRGDQVLLDHYKKYKEDVTAEDFVVTLAEIDAAYKELDKEVVESLKFSADNIRRFHEAQLEKESWSIEVLPGIQAGRLMRPMDVAGCYVPGRRAAYPSSVLMTIIPAKVAGVKKVIACTPPDTGIAGNAATLVAADIVGCDELYKVGGPWAVGAMAFGTETIPKTDNIVGPGNIYVTAAKMAVFGHVDIDSPAGPSESLILADDTANPLWTAVDLLSQLEHDPDAGAALVTTSGELAGEVCRIIAEEYESLPRKDILEKSFRFAAVIVARDMDEAIEITNEYAAEHLQIVTRDPFLVMARINHAGSIFLGDYAPVPAGDYSSGTNHVLPTGQAAKMFSGLSVDDFIKKPTFQYLSKEGLATLRHHVVRLANEEGLPIHARAIEERFK